MKFKEEELVLKVLIHHHLLPVTPGLKFKSIRIKEMEPIYSVRNPGRNVTVSYRDRHRYRRTLTLFFYDSEIKDAFTSGVLDTAPL